MALAFLPPDMVRNTYNELCARYYGQFPQVFVHADIAGFLAYFEQQWLSEETVPISQWSVYNTVDRRTNNHCEGWHNRIRHKLGNHPNFWRACDGLLAEQDHFERTIAAMEVGQRASRRNSKYVALQDRIERLCAQFAERNCTQPCEFVVAVGSNLQRAYWSARQQQQGGGEEAAGADQHQGGEGGDGDGHEGSDSSVEGSVGGSVGGSVEGSDEDSDEDSEEGSGQGGGEDDMAVNEDL